MGILFLSRSAARCESECPHITIKATTYILFFSWGIRDIGSLSFTTGLCVTGEKRNLQGHSLSTHSIIFFVLASVLRWWTSSIYCPIKIPGCAIDTAAPFAFSGLVDWLNLQALYMGPSWSKALGQPAVLLYVLILHGHWPLQGCYTGPKQWSTSVGALSLKMSFTAIPNMEDEAIMDSNSPISHAVVQRHLQCEYIASAF